MPLMLVGIRADAVERYDGLLQDVLQQVLPAAWRILRKWAA